MKTDDNTVMCHEVCTGCSCCLLSCPVWRRTADRSLTAQGRNKALQGGAAIEEISDAIDACLLCGTCRQNCPEDNDIVGLTIEHRRLLNETRKDHPTWYLKIALKQANGISPAYNHTGITLLAGDALKADRSRCDAALRLIGNGCMLATDDGGEIVKMIEAGLKVDQSIIESFIQPLTRAKQLIVAQGNLQRHLRKWLPKTSIIGMGEALLSIASIRRSLTAQDLYIIESCGLHSDYARLVGFYDRLRQETGAQLNLDLQRIAVPTGTASLQAGKDMEAAGCIEQAKWILYNRKVSRIVVESVEDVAVFKSVTNIPVVHIAELAGR
ncbi:MAG: hypothetical protein A3J24_06960 [Deltaproteobacteria bacterium RIFCSPLOWO2_02_FULL_53_8]|nr:MAG: hypothetical protein A3J24_06960 [Deltaproteobacteria bacterium RIFCSPLOWO2_02_FULL_53_8]